MPVKKRNKFEMGSYYRCSFWFLLITGYYYSVFSSATSKIRKGELVRDGGESIISSGEKFALGFFSPQGSQFRYVGIWYQGLPVQSVVWVANRERPISGNGGALSIGDDGNLQITRGDGEIVWSSNVTAASSNSTAVLMDTGNLVILASEDSKRVLWQSFDYPTDTYLPDMEVHMNARGGERRVFTSWKSVSDPSPGNYSMGVDPRGSPQIVIWEGADRRWRSGHWNGLTFIGVPDVKTVYLFGFRLSNQGDGNIYFTYTPTDESFVKFQLNWEGVERQETWNDEQEEWRLIQSHPSNECDLYNRCGPFGKCDRTDRMRCNCLEGFVINDPDQWSRGNWSGGCTRRAELECRGDEGSSVDAGEKDGFFQVENAKLPDFVDYVGLQSMKECQELCLHNCSCTAFAYVSGINCMIWTRDLVDVQQFVDGGNTLFVRLAYSELGEFTIYNKEVINLVYAY